MQGSKRHLEASPRSGGPGGGLQDSPKDWCITAIDATARATLLTYAIANRQDSSPPASSAPQRFPEDQCRAANLATIMEIRNKSEDDTCCR